MKIVIKKRHMVPQTSIFCKVLRTNRSADAPWDRQVMILIHGGPGGNHTLYSDIEDELLILADLVIIDLRGCGFSDKSDVKFCTIKENIEDIEEIRNSLKIKNPIIHGCSYGAIVALGYSIKYNNIVSKLILTSGTSSSNFLQSAKDRLSAIGNKEQILAAKRLWEGEFENPDQFSEFYELMAPLYIYNSFPVSSAPAKKTGIPYNIALTNFAYKTFLREFDYRNDLHLVTIPTLIFSGENDWIMNGEQANVLHNGIVGSRLVSFKNCGHFPWKDRKNDFISELSIFLE